MQPALPPIRKRAAVYEYKKARGLDQSVLEEIDADIVSRQKVIQDNISLSFMFHVHCSGLPAKTLFLCMKFLSTWLEMFRRLSPRVSFLPLNEEMFSLVHHPSTLFKREIIFQNMSIDNKNSPDPNNVVINDIVHDNNENIDKTIRWGNLCMTCYPAVQ